MPERKLSIPARSVSCACKTTATAHSTKRRAHGKTLSAPPLCKFYNAYWAHKADAKARGKDGKFTLEEWINWWEEKLGPDWLRNAGLERDQAM